MKFIFLLSSLLIHFSAWSIDCEEQKKMESYTPIYAKKFSIDYYEDYKVVKSLNERFIVSDKKKIKCTSSLPVFSSTTERFVATSTTHLAFLNFFSLENKLVAFPGVRYIYNEILRNKKVANISSHLNPEELLSFRPDLLMAYSQDFSSDDKIKHLRKVGIPIVLNHDFLEVHPLARAEWMIFSAVFFSKDKEAQALFKKIEANYLKVKNSISATSTRPLVLVGDIQNGKWVTCGGRSDLGILIADAGGKLFLENDQTNTQYLSLEKVISMKESPNFWLAQNTWNDLSTVVNDSRYVKFQKVSLYNNNQKLNEQGFNDYWEMGMARPDLLIQDLAFIFRGEKASQNKLSWYKKLK